MAAELVGGALLSSFIDIVIDRLLTTDAVNLVLGKELGPDLVDRLKTALLGAEALVADAEMKQFGQPLVRKWLDSLRDAVYCAEDLLDTVLIKATTQKKECSCCSLSFFINRHRDDMVDNMERVVSRIEDLGKQKDFLGLEKIPTGGSSWRTPTSSLVRGNVYGREDDQKALVQMLKDNNEHHLSVIAIVGIGGVGKTTLAQWLYNNEESQDRRVYESGISVNVRGTTRCSSTSLHFLVLQISVICRRRTGCTQLDSSSSQIVREVGGITT
ncbi:putative disease resistance RPP13-like protein 1 [Arachis hypogaea]|nr:Putative disease resistance RPP13-like protein [Arachis hypogaea]